MKNVIAIACGLVKGKNLGENAKAAIITREFQKLLDLVLKWEQKEILFMGYLELGDLTLTCSSLKIQEIQN